MRMMTVPFVLCTISVLSATASAAVKTQDVKYTVDKTEYIGFLAYDDASDVKRPGILIAPEWVGLNDYSRGRAKQLADMGYVAFVFDPYGGGKNAADVKQSAEWSGALKADRPELRKRITAGLETLKKQDRVNTEKIAAIGYCFGGTTVLELARGGADIAGVVSFHGGLSTTMPAKAGELKAKVLVCHGAIDPFVPPEEVAAFEKEMQDAKADWQLVKYGNAVHSFTNPAAKGQVPGAEYNEKADRRSWEAMKGFLGEMLGERAALGPKNAVFADAGNAQRIVFVCDATGTMINKMDAIRSSLADAIGQLSNEQAFNVIFFTDGKKVVSWQVEKLVPATISNKEKARAFLLTVEATGTTYPLPAIKTAYRNVPDLIYYLTDGEYNSLISYDEFTKAFRDGNEQVKARVNTVLFETYDAACEGVLQKLSSEFGGAYRYVRIADLK